MDKSSEIRLFSELNTRDENRVLKYFLSTGLIIIHIHITGVDRVYHQQGGRSCAKAQRAFAEMFGFG